MMDIKLNKPKTIIKFSHERSESNIFIEPDKEGVTIRFADEDTSASLLLSNNEDISFFLSLIKDIKKKHPRDIRGLHFEGVVLTIYYTNYGDPFSESICFSFCVADSKDRYCNTEFCVELDLNDVTYFSNEINKLINSI